MADSNSRRGKVYSCLHCEAAGKTYVEVRYRIIAHVYKHHLALDKAPFYCTLCLMRCTTKSALVNHVTRYSRHRLSLTELGQADSSRFLVENSNPAILMLGNDFRELTEAESTKMVPSKCPETASETGSDINMGGSTVLQSTNSSGLISVQLSPEMLAQLLKSSSTTQGPNQATFVPYSPAPSTTIPTYIPTPIINNSIVKPTPEPLQYNRFKPVSMPGTTPSTPVSRANQLCQQPSNSNLCEPEPPLIARKVSLPLPSTEPSTVGTTLYTPVLGSSFDIMSQLLDEHSSELDYDFDEGLLDENITQSGPNDEASRIDVAVQTEEPTPEPESKKRRLEEPFNQNPLTEAVQQLVQGSIAQVLDAFEKNSRAIRGIDKTLGVLSEAVVRMNRTMERMGEEQRREHERRREVKKEPAYDRRTERSNEKKENYKPLKSVVNKK